MPQPVALRLSLLIAAVAGGVIVAMVAQIGLAHRGVELMGVWQALLRGGGRQLNGALAWWAITGIAFLASFLIAAVASRISWLYLRSLRWVAAAALALALAAIADKAPLSPPGAAGAQALATFSALLAAMMMAWFGAFFAVRR
jgi:hypothetical protein